MYGARIPALYYNSGNMAAAGSGQLATYNNALLVVAISVVPVMCFGMFWSIAYMLFHKEFTACPGE